MPLDSPVAVTRRPYSKHVRALVVHMYFENEHTMTEIANEFANHPCVRTVQRIVASYIADGSMELQGQKGRVRPCRKMNDDVKQLLADIVERIETSRLSDIAIRLCGEADVQQGFYSSLDVCRALHEMGFSRVRVYNRAAEADPQYQREWVDYCRSSGIELSHWVFLDEVYVDSRVTNAKYAWVPSGHRSKVKSLFVQGRRYTTIAAISAAGMLAYWTFGGPADADAFKTFILDHLLPKLNTWPNDNSVLMMDNCRIHSKEWLYDLAQFVGFRVKFLLLYSPQYNPIEKVFGVTKLFLRNNARDLAGLPGRDAIALALEEAGRRENCRAFLLNTPDNPYSLEL